MKRLLMVIIFVIVFTGISDAQNILKADQETIKIENSGNAEMKYRQPYIDISQKELAKRFIVKDSGDTDKVLILYLNRKKLENKKYSTDLECYIKDTNSGIKKQLTFGMFKSVKLDNFSSQLLNNINKLFPIEGRVMQIENDNIIIDIGNKLNIKRGDEFNIIDDNDTKMGLAKIIKAYREESTAKIIRGKTDIEEGYFLKYRAKLAGYFGIKHKMFPLEFEINPDYEALVGETTDEPTTNGSSTILCVGIITDKFVFNAGTGVSFYGGITTAWNIIDVSVGYDILIIHDYLNIEFVIGGGWSSLGDIEWARDPNNTYSDTIGKNSGNVFDSSFYFNPVSYIHFFPTRFFSISCGAGYYISSRPKFDEYCQGEDENKQCNEIKEEWLQYNVNSIGGMMLEFGVNIWFD